MRVNKYLPNRYDGVIPGVIIICEAYNRERFSIQWLRDVITDSPGNYPLLSAMISEVSPPKFKEYLSKCLGKCPRFEKWNGASAKCRAYTYIRGVE